MRKKRVISAARKATDKALDNKERIRPFVKDDHYATAVVSLKVLRWALKLLDRG